MKERNCLFYMGCQLVFPFKIYLSEKIFLYCLIYLRILSPYKKYNFTNLPFVISLLVFPSFPKFYTANFSLLSKLSCHITFITEKWFPQNNPPPRLPPSPDPLFLNHFKLLMCLNLLPAELCFCQSS